MREVEAQPLRRDIASLLRYVRAENVSQRLVQKVGRGVQASRHLTVVGQAAFERAGRATRLVLVFFEERLERRFVHGDALLGRELSGQADRESVGVVETKGILRRVLGPALTPDVRDDLLELAQTAAERSAELGFLVPQLLANLDLCAVQLRIGRSVLFDDNFGESRRKSFAEAQLPAVANRSADELRRMYPRSTFDGVTPSAIRKVDARM